MDTFRYAALGLTLAAGLTGSGTAFAAFSCYETDLYPSLYGLSFRQGHLEVALPRDPAAPQQPDMQINRHLVQGEDGTWKMQPRLCTDSRCSRPENIGGSCAIDIPLPALSLAEVKSLAPERGGDMEQEDIEQKVGACVEQDGVVWFGIVYYCGEGTCGVGGIGRYDTRTRKVEVRRPKALVMASVSPIVFDGKYLWAGTFESSECIGEDPVSGLVRYDWAGDEAVSFGGGTDDRHDPNGPCGFRFNDIYVDKQGLWASSDMGLAHLTNPQADPAAMQWVNYMPKPGDSRAPLDDVACTGLYAQLLKILPHKDGGDEYAGHYEQFAAVLRRFNPGLASQLVGPDPSH